MGITINKQALNRMTQRILAVKGVIDDAAVEVFIELGEFLVSNIRSGAMSHWNNQEGNLRSSVGFVVSKRGRVVKMSDFPIVLNGAQGAARGKDAALRFAASHAHIDIALGIVVGEEYAAYVEAIESRVVLSSSYLYAERHLPHLLRTKLQAAIHRYENRR